MKDLNVALIGHKFMGKAHTHAYTDLPIFFNPDVRVVKKLLCSNEADVKEVSKQWGWEGYTLRWEEAVESKQIDVIDIAAPSSLHGEIAIAAARAGKHVFCEKPLALTLEKAKEMMLEVEKAGVINMIGFNYRRVPALAYAKELIDSGMIGEVYHFRGIYQQSWLVDPMFPLAWRLQKSEAGYGSHGDMGAHVIDLARFLVGEVEEVLCEQRTFVRERPKPLASSGLSAVAGKEMGVVDVDDASSMIMKFKGKAALGYFEATRFGTGHRNQNFIEINGSKGAIKFNMEQMNELDYYSCADADGVQGFRKIIVGEPSHPYMGSWWPSGHIIGFGDTFVNEMFDFVQAIAKERKVHPDFRDGFICQQILETAQISSQTRRWQKVDEV